MTANPVADRSELDALKANVDLVELISQSGVELKRVGKNHVGRCPFHEDHEASLSVNPEKNLWNCFGCNAGGDALQFLQLKEKVQFPEALKRLRGQVSPVVPAVRPTPDPSPDILAGKFKRSDLFERVADHQSWLAHREAKLSRRLPGITAAPGESTNP